MKVVLLPTRVQKQEISQIVGLRPLMWMTNFPTGKHIASPPTSLVHWGLVSGNRNRKLINTRFFSNCLVVIWRGSFGNPQFWGDRGEFGDGHCLNRKPTHDFPKPLKTSTQTLSQQQQKLQRNALENLCRKYPRLSRHFWMPNLGKFSRKTRELT